MGEGLALRTVRSDEDEGVTRKNDETKALTRNGGDGITNVEFRRAMSIKFESTLQESTDGAFDADLTSRNYVRMLQFLETEMTE